MEKNQQLNPEELIEQMMSEFPSVEDTSEQDSYQRDDDLKGKRDSAPASKDRKPKSVNRRVIMAKIPEDLFQQLKAVSRKEEIALQDIYRKSFTMFMAAYIAKHGNPQLRRRRPSNIDNLV